jgi:hypothetical protein
MIETDLLPCPFCGKQMDIHCDETLHRSSTAWKDTKYGRGYVRYHEECDGYCYEVHCNKIYGGCGATITDDSIEEVIAAWNKRSK